MNGFELAEVLRGNEETKNVPIIFLTAGAFDIADEVEILATAQDFMLKSVDNEKIMINMYMH